MAWEWHTGKALSYLHIPEWKAEGIQIGFSSRAGGVSSSPYNSLNMGLHVGDAREAVLENRRLWLKEWGANWTEVVIGEQIHGREVYWVGLEDAGRGSQEIGTAVPGTDGLLTFTNIGLMAFFADCVPLYFYHPGIQAVGIAHAGWKGTAGKIALVVLEKLKEAGGKPEECWVAIGPSIGPCCYEIDQRVAGVFEANFDRVPFLKPIKSNYYLLDLWEANRMLLLQAGVLAKNIWAANICTACHTNWFFSHRRDGQHTGRMAGWIRLGKRGGQTIYGDHSNCRR